MDFETEKKIIELLSKDIIPLELSKSNVVDLTIRITDSENEKLMANIAQLHSVRDLRNFKVYTKREKGDLIYILRIEMGDW